VSARVAGLWGGAVVAVAAVVAFTIEARMIGVDSAYHLVIAQEVFLGRRPYEQIFDLQPPASIYMQMAPIALHHDFGAPIVAAWNLYLLAVYLLFGLTLVLLLRPRHRLLCALGLGALFGVLVDDVHNGQRELIFSLAWSAYLLARTRPVGSRAGTGDGLAGLLLSVITCAKPIFAPIIVAYELLALSSPQGRRNLTPLIVLVAAGLAQLAQFLLAYPMSAWTPLPGIINYYGTVGVDYMAAARTIFGNLALYVTIAVLIGVLALERVLKLDHRFAVGCLITVVAGVALFVMQGAIRSYYWLLLTPLVIVLAFATLLRVERLPAPRRWPRLAALAVLGIALLQAASIEGGIGRALLKRYAWNMADVARIGAYPEDAYMRWVRANVAPDAYVAPIALQYGGTSAFDPILSTLRLGRRVQSYAPILQFPLRAALVSGDAARIDWAWGQLIKELSEVDTPWIVIRRTTPTPLPDDLLEIIERSPRINDWLAANYRRVDAFGPYVAFRRRRE
jgi:hypothetical protein